MATESQDAHYAHGRAGCAGDLHQGRPARGSAAAGGRFRHLRPVPHSAEPFSVSGNNLGRCSSPPLSPGGLFRSGPIAAPVLGEGAPAKMDWSDFGAQSISPRAPLPDGPPISMLGDCALGDLHTLGFLQRLSRCVLLTQAEPGAPNPRPRAWEGQERGVQRFTANLNQLVFPWKSRALESKNPVSYQRIPRSLSRPCPRASRSGC